jgi:hypothetical protein
MSKFTQGPWRWEVNQKTKRIYLCGGSPKYDREILGFCRWGMQGAAPVLQDDAGLLYPFHEIDGCVVQIKGMEHHASWCSAVRHPVMQMIEAAPDLYATLEYLEMWMVDILGLEDDDAELVRTRKALAKVRGEK